MTATDVRPAESLADLVRPAAVRAPPYRHQPGTGPATHARRSSASAPSTPCSTPPSRRRSASGRLWLIPPAAVRARGGRRAARARRPQPVADVDDRPGLLRHGHAAGDPAQRAREPGLVHRLHAVPARDLARAGSRRCSTSRPMVERPHRPARSPTRRCSTRRTAAAEAMTLARRALDGTAGDRVFVVDADALPQTHRGGAHPRRAAGHRGRRRRPRRRRCRDGDAVRRPACQYPGASGRGARPARRSSTRRTSGGALVASSPPTCWR